MSERLYYPVHILPKPSWGIMDSGKIIRQCPSAIVARWFPGEKEEIISSEFGEGRGSLYYSAIKDMKIPNLSVNLLGTLVEIEDFRYNRRNGGDEKWEPGTLVSISDFQPEEDYYEIEGDITVIGWEMAKLHERPVNFPKDLNKEEEFYRLREEVKDQISKGLGDKIPSETYNQLIIGEYLDLKVKDGIKCPEGIDKGSSEGRKKLKKLPRTIDWGGETRLNHDPRNLDYWHFVMDLYVLESPEEPILKGKQAWFKSMCNVIKDRLRRTGIYLERVPQSAKISDWQKLI